MTLFSPRRSCARSTSRPASTRSRTYRRRLQLESLEARQLLAVNIANVTLTPSTIDEGGTVTLSGSLDPPPVAPPITTVGAFTGGDTGEGLDLDGNFKYAVNV